jgi:hypothetical protein
MVWSMSVSAVTWLLEEKRKKEGHKRVQRAVKAIFSERKGVYPVTRRLTLRFTLHHHPFLDTPTHKHTPLPHPLGRDCSCTRRLRSLVRPADHSMLALIHTLRPLLSHLISSTCHQTPEEGILTYSYPSSSSPSPYPYSSPYPSLCL